MNTDEFIKKVLDDVKASNLDDIPNIDLYMDQVTTYLNQKFDFAKRHEDDKLLTKTMINNYAKSRLLPPPEKKKYSPDHIIVLAMIFFFKNVISINDVTAILNPLIDRHFQNDDMPLSDYMDLFFNYIHTSDLSDNIMKDLEKSMTLFQDSDTAEQEYMQTLSLVAMLSYETFVRKMIIERLIDSLPELSKESGEEKSKADAEKKKEKQKEKDKKKEKNPESDS